MDDEQFWKWLKKGYQDLERSKQSMDMFSQLHSPGTAIFEKNTADRRDETSKELKKIGKKQDIRSKHVTNFAKDVAQNKSTLTTLGARRRAIGIKKSEDLTLDEARSYHKYSNEIEKELDQRLNKMDKEIDIATNKTPELVKDPHVEAMDKKLKSWEDKK